ncbi:hypothetical protein DTO282E5_4651 [Paecilomyces variotii]|nr:hypothetical protein DTO282E5_4651 [Paecilomyces variotii]
MGSSSRLTPLSPSRCFKDRLLRRLHYNLFYPSLQRSSIYMPEAVVFNQSTIDNYNQSSYYYWRWYDR